MSGLKGHLHALNVSGGHFAVTPDEIDRYEVFNFVNAGTVANWWASAGTSGTADTVALAIINRIPDYPRSVQFALAGSAAGMTGTLDINGRDQFGGSITEALTFAGASNGGTVAGTRVFAQVTGGTLRYGTAAGVGTPAIGFVPGTACLLGLPVRLQGTTDVVHIGMAAGTGAITVNGGTIASFVNSPMSAVRAPAALTGTQAISVWVTPTFNNQNLVKMSNGTQAT